MEEKAMKEQSTPGLNNVVTVQLYIPGLIPQHIIDTCPSPQCREYMENKNKKTRHEYQEKMKQELYEAMNSLYQHT